MNKAVLSAVVLENDLLAKGVMKMKIEYKTNTSFDRSLLAVKPGQFVNVYLDRKDLLLPRPISICEAEAAVLTLVYAIVGKGTEEMAQYTPGKLLRVSTPLGNGFPVDEQDLFGAKTALVVGGGLGVPPMLELAKDLRGKGIAVSAVLGFRDECFLTDEFAKIGAQVHVATESGQSGLKGFVTDAIISGNLTADRYFSCGPKPMLKALAELCGKQEKEIAVSLEERMGCGYGACVACTCKIKDGGSASNKRVCKDGPIFWGSEVDWDA